MLLNVLGESAGWEKVAACLKVLVITTAMALGGNGAALAQCEPAWHAFDPSTAAIPGTSFSISDQIMWDQDGPGPIAPKLVVAGNFSTAGNAAASCIALVDLATGNWSSLGSGIGGNGTFIPWVNCLAILPNGDLVAGGRFTVAGGVSASSIARWNGVSWAPFGSGMGNSGSPPDVTSLAVLPNGDLVAGGLFTAAGGASASSIARWNGTGWSALGSGMTNGSSTCFVSSLLVLPSGDLVAGGEFNSAGGISANRIARWNGSSWSAMGSGMSGSSTLPVLVAELAILPSGDLVAGGRFTFAGGVMVNGIARWDGLNWSPFGSGMGNGESLPMVHALQVLASGDLLAGGSFTTAGGVGANCIARWNGSSWSPLGSGMSGADGSKPYVSALTILPNGDLVAGGSFGTAGGVPLNNIASWNGSTWSAMLPGINGFVRAMAVLPNGDFLAGGSFTTIGGVAAQCIGRWNGSVWSDLGQGVMQQFVDPAVVSAIAVLNNGDVVVAGGFNKIGGVDAKNIARWNGSTWSALGSGIDGTLNTLAVLSSGDLVAGGLFTSAGGVPANHVARWDGSTWSALGAGFNASVNALKTLPNGDLVAGGYFSKSGLVTVNFIARWNGVSWSAIGDGVGATVFALAGLPNGDLVAGGWFTSAGGNPANRIARWNGSTWSQVGGGVNSDTYALVAMPDGDLIAGGLFTVAGGTPARRIARWNGTTWSALDVGLGSSVGKLMVLPSGDLIAAGQFSVIGSVFAPYFARWKDPRQIFITDQPDNVAIDANQSLILSAAVNEGLAGMSVQWRRNDTDIVDGPGGASSGGGAVSGSSGLLSSPTTAAPITLTITQAKHSDSGNYTAIFSNSCDSAITYEAVVTINAECAGDFNSDNVVDDSDFVVFVQAYNLLDCEDPTIPLGCPADFTLDGLVDNSDFVIFVAAYNALVCS